MSILKHTFTEMRRQPLISAVTLTGTALAIFLIMTVVMIQDVNVMPFAPESNRARFLHARFLNISNIGSDSGSSGNMSYQTAKKLYGSLESAEAVSIHKATPDAATAGIAGEAHVDVDKLETDGEFWKVFDFTFISGKPYGNEETGGNGKSVVLSESVARDIFGSVDVTGREIFIDHFTPYTVCGVVRDVPMMASSAYAGIWIPLTKGTVESSWGDYFGPVCATILAPSSDNFSLIRAEIDRRIQSFNTELGVNGKELIHHGSPYTQEKLQYVKASNIDPEVFETPEKRTRMLVYTILLLIPAINLSSMTQSRLRRRVSELGVRRAFGCTRRRLMTEILNENLLMTIIGSLIGLLAGIICVWTMADTLFADQWKTGTSANLTPGMLIQWPIFFKATIFCFILNILSCGIPAWRAAMMKPTEAIGGLQK